ncbi:MAG: Glu/Leu/Phe/Val dehydrogenase dimerization domain-containing protein [bacterium]|nr:Glu/Leu/Phe/Val dehydrogenase dimerization domain-containing protein [bacterium]
MIKDIPTDTHKRLIKFQDAGVGLKGFIAIHNTNLGPAAGGTRFKTYSNDNEAIQDALSLSKAMTYKCALAGVPYGGGKAVIIDSGKKDKELFESYARVVNYIKGQFMTGKDAGIGDREINYMSDICPYISSYVGSEDPSVYASLGVFSAMKSVLKKVYGGTSMDKIKVSIKGLGKVGFELARIVYEAGGRLVVADVDEERLKMAEEKFKGIKIVSPDEIHKIKSNIYAPCALGNEFSEQNIKEINALVICGGANNQLSSPSIGRKLMDRGIVYVPDYVANAGGLIAVVDGFQHKKFSSDRVKMNLRVIEDNVSKVLEISSLQNRPTHEIADELAENRFNIKINR